MDSLPSPSSLSEGALHMLTDLRIGGVGLGVGLSYVLALWVNTHSLVVLPSQICRAIEHCYMYEWLRV